MFRVISVNGFVERTVLRIVNPFVTLVLIIQGRLNLKHPRKTKLQTLSFVTVLFSRGTDSPVYTTTSPHGPKRDQVRPRCTPRYTPPEWKRGR